MPRKTADLNYREVCQQIQEERPEGFKVDCIVVNFDKVGYNIDSIVLDRICDRLKDQAEYYLNDEITVSRNNSIDDLWTYEIVHSCGGSPLYDSKNEEFYCPDCESPSIFDY